MYVITHRSWYDIVNIFSPTSISVHIVFVMSVYFCVCFQLKPYYNHKTKKIQTSYLTCILYHRCPFEWHQWLVTSAVTFALKIMFPKCIAFWAYYFTNTCTSCFHFKFFIRDILKLYCRYLYTRPCMKNHIWGLKQLWLQVNGHAWFHLQRLRWPVRNGEGAKNSKWKYMSTAGFEPMPRQSTTGKLQRLRPLGHEGLMEISG